MERIVRRLTVGFVWLLGIRFRMTLFVPPMISLFTPVLDKIHLFPSICFLLIK